MDGITTVATPYMPPSDWINIDDCADGNINLLVADTTMATYAFVCTTSLGQYHVDWGDGTSGDFNSGATAQHTYTVGTGQVCSRGYTTFKIVISPVSGNLTSFAVTSHSLAMQSQEYHILSCVVGAPALTTLANAFYKSASPTVFCRVLENFKTISNMTSLTNAGNMFNSCHGLQSVNMGIMASIIDATSMFNACYSLKTVNVSTMISLTTATTMFQSCYSFRDIDISNMISLTTATSMFNSCYGLQNVNIGMLINVTTATSMFSSCYNIQSIDMSNMTALTNTTTMFNACYSLQSINIGILSSVTNATSMFNFCYNLQSVNISSMTALINTTTMFNACYSLRDVDMGILSSVTNATSMFNNCRSLQNVNISSMINVIDATSMFNNCYGLVSLISTDFAQNATSTLCTTMFVNCEQLVDINLSNAKITKLSIRGTSGRLNKLATLTFNASSTFSNATSPQLDLGYTTLTAAQLDTIFTLLPTVTSKTVDITGSTGAATCTRTIATGKGWTVTG